MTRVLYISLLACMASLGVSAPSIAQVCNASWYGPGFQGKKMANGKHFNMHNPTIIAHKSLPLGTTVRLTNLRNGRSAIAQVQDRGPYVRGRCVDVSKALAIKLGYIGSGTTRIRLEVL